MYRKLVIAILVGVSFIGYDSASANISIKKPTQSEVRAAAEPCLPGGTKIPINDKYSCPVGAMSQSNNKELSKEMIECSIQMALTFAAIDEVGKKWAEELQKSREKDINKWTEDIRAKIYGDGGIANEYRRVCLITNWTVPEGTEKYGCAKSTDFFPETSCQAIAEKKAMAYENIGYILASKGIAKSFQNDKDSFLDKQKTAYDGILDKWSFYKRMVGNAVSKFNAYIKQTVQ